MAVGRAGELAKIDALSKVISAEEVTRYDDAAHAPGGWRWLAKVEGEKQWKAHYTNSASSLESAFKFQLLNISSRNSLKNLVVVILRSERRRCPPQTPVRS